MMWTWFLLYSTEVKPKTVCTIETHIPFVIIIGFCFFRLYQSGQNYAADGTFPVTRLTFSTNMYDYINLCQKPNPWIYSASSLYDKKENNVWQESKACCNMSHIFWKLSPLDYSRDVRKDWQLTILPASFLVSLAKCRGEWCCYPLSAISFPT